MKYLVTSLFWLAFGLAAPIGMVAGFVIFLGTLPFDPDRKILHAFLCHWTFRFLTLWPGWRVEVRGRDRLPRPPCVLVCNHQSMADAVAAMGLFHDFKFVSKASLFDVPVIGWMMRLAGYVPLERGRPKSAAEMIERCKKWLSRGVSVLLFPEGTYRDGNQMLPFKRGAFVLSVEQALPVVPVIIRGTTELILQDGPWMGPRCHILVEVLEPVSPAGRDPESLAQEVRTRMERALLLYR